jgi:segregation and condensation protein A
MGRQFEDIPDDLFIPPNALEICLEAFSGPLDLLLYLIRKENINILDLDVSKITDQYVEYIELMDSLKFDLAADYLVMAATLAEIKSRLMLPRESFDEEEDDPRASLIKRLQEYQRFKNVSEKIALIPRLDRDFYVASAKLPKLEDQKNNEVLITKNEIFDSILEVLNRPNYKDNHQIDFEELSTKERIQMILDLLSKTNIISFSKTLKKPEGKKGIVVTLLASLELAKDGYVELIQNKSEELFIKSSRRI